MAVALGLAAFLAFMTAGAGAFHQHGGEAGAAQLDCRGCAWTHAANGVPGQAPRIVASIDTAALPWTTVRLDVPSLFPTQRTTRGPPSLSL